LASNAEAFDLGVPGIFAWTKGDHHALRVSYRAPLRHDNLQQLQKSCKAVAKSQGPLRA